MHGDVWSVTAGNFKQKEKISCLFLFSPLKNAREAVHTQDSR